MESAQSKNSALEEAGALVPTSFEGLEPLIKETYDGLVEQGVITPIADFKPPPVPQDLNAAIKAGKVRAPTHIISTISDDRGLAGSFNLVFYRFCYPLSNAHNTLTSWIFVLLSLHRGRSNICRG